MCIFLTDILTQNHHLYHVPTVILSPALYTDDHATNGGSAAALWPRVERPAGAAVVVLLPAAAAAPAVSDHRLLPLAAAVVHATGGFSPLSVDLP